MTLAILWAVRATHCTAINFENLVHDVVEMILDGLEWLCSHHEIFLPLLKALALTNRRLENQVRPRLFK